MPSHMGREAQAMPAAPHHGHRLRDRGSASTGPLRRSAGTSQAILPTPDPTIASCISDEDVARQLIALGDASNFSMGRTSASTLDDGLSGVADVAWSTGATSDSDEGSDHETGPSGDRPSVRRDSAFDSIHQKAHRHGSRFSGENVTRGSEEPDAKRIKIKPTDRQPNAHRAGSTAAAAKVGPAGKNRTSISSKGSKTAISTGMMRAPNVPMASPGTKSASTTLLSFQHQLAEDEEDLSSKPRCQRCRKSKKGCDRQRPCQRCKDAGIGIEGCISEDEGNGRKGRYGRHMGVVVKKPSEDTLGEGMAMHDPTPGPGGPETAADKGKKRKR